MSTLMRNTVDRLDRPSAYYLSKVQTEKLLGSQFDLFNQTKRC